MSGHIVVLDLGAHTIKGGFPDSDFPCSVIPNCVAKTTDNKTYYGEFAGDVGTYFLGRPFENGLFIDPNMQYEVLKQMFSRRHLNVSIPGADTSTQSLNPKDCTLVICEPVHNPTSVSEILEEILLEDYNFGRICIFPAPSFTVHAFSSDEPTEVQSGYQGRSSRATALYESRAMESYTRQRTVQEVQVMHFGSPEEELLSPLSSNPCCLVIDLGHSHCTVTPVLEFIPYLPGIQRVSVGGELLTNKLVDVLRKRNLPELGMHMLHADLLKERMLMVSPDYLNQMRRAALQQKEFAKKISVLMDVRKQKDTNELFKEVQLPSLRDEVKAVDGRRGRRLNAFEQVMREAKVQKKLEEAKAEVKEEEVVDDTMDIEEEEEAGPIIRLNADRISLAEGLFCPIDLGVPEIGLAEAVENSILRCPVELRPMLAGNIVVVGGTAKMQGLIERLVSEIRERIDIDWPVHVRMHKDSDMSVWRGMAKFARDPTAIFSNSISKEDWLADKQARKRTVGRWANKT